MSHGTGATQCPHCGAVGNFTITMTNGGQVLNCKNCPRHFTAEVKHKQFTGKNR